MGYPGPMSSPPPVPKSIPLVPVTEDLDLNTDVVVVGSGAGGGTAAAILAKAGLDVVVLEAGDYRNESDFTHLEADAYRDLYLQKGLGATVDSGITILSGATRAGARSSTTQPPSQHRQMFATSGTGSPDFLTYSPAPAIKRPSTPSANGSPSTPSTDGPRGASSCSKRDSEIWAGTSTNSLATPSTARRAIAATALWDAGLAQSSRSSPRI